MFAPMHVEVRPFTLFRLFFLAGITESSPLHQYNMDVGDDDVFMVRVNRQE